MAIEGLVAKAIAERHVALAAHHADPAVEGWAGASARSPRLVHDSAGCGAYWLVPFARDGQSIGALRVMLDGSIAAVARYRDGSDITMINETSAARAAYALVEPIVGDSLGEVLLVHDGPKGREAWRVEVVRDKQVVRWVFVVPGGTYVRDVR